MARRALRSSLLGTILQLAWGAVARSSFEHVPGLPKHHDQSHWSIANVLVLEYRYEKEFDQVQDVFELQVGSAVLPNLPVLLCLQIANIVRLL